MAENHQIYVTSYATFRQDSEIYRDLSFDFLFLDEAQVMKNAQTKIAQSLRRFVVPSVFALSGTPIENHLGELWSIFQIVLPGLLPAKKEFVKLSTERVAQFIKPFVMRRKKEEVLTELPDLIEVVYKNELEDQQKSYLSCSTATDAGTFGTGKRFGISTKSRRNFDWTHASASDL